MLILLVFGCTNQNPKPQENTDVVISCGELWPEENGKYTASYIPPHFSGPDVRRDMEHPMSRQDALNWVTNELRRDISDAQQYQKQVSADDATRLTRLLDPKTKRIGEPDTIKLTVEVIQICPLFSPDYSGAMIVGVRSSQRDLWPQMIVELGGYGNEETRIEFKESKNGRPSAKYVQMLGGHVVEIVGYYPYGYDKLIRATKIKDLGWADEIVKEK